MLKHAQTGFTLIEVIFAVAISSAMIIIVIGGFSNMRGQAQFSASIEKSMQDVLEQRQEALSTVKLNGGGLSCASQADNCNVTFGRLLTFSPGSSIVKVETLVTSANPAPAAGQAVTVQASDSFNYTLPWGVTFVSAQRTGPPLGSVSLAATQVAFSRVPTDGTLQSAISLNSGGWPGMSTGNYTYGNFVAGGSAVNLNFVDPDGRKAFLTITPANNGVTRTFQ